MTTPREAWADILMITYSRPDYVAVTLPHLLENVDDRTRIWLWHNGDDADVLDVVNSYRTHPRVHRFHHSQENVKLRPPTNWLWQEARGDLLGKVDDDCLLPAGWVDRLRHAHADHDFGVIGSWRFLDEDWREDLSAPKLRDYPGGHRLLRNLWVQGSGYLVPKPVVERIGSLREGQSFAQWCITVARSGLDNGWLMPFIHEQHLDDPRLPASPLRSDEDLRRHLPLSAQVHGVTTLDAWTEQMRRSAVVVQSAPLDPRAFSGWRARRRRAWRRVQRIVKGRSTW